MPTAATFTIKTADETTDRTWTLRTKAGADKTPAVWAGTDYTGTTDDTNRPMLRVMSYSNKEGTRRTVKGSFTFPQTYVDANTGLTQVLTRVNGEFSLNIPLNASDAVKLGAAHAFAHVQHVTQLIDAMSSGYAPA